ncbi:hypothetical protein DC366_08665 [Pelagivirga sediminicola]|uniref:Uncharacterized protein n=1 Tax=Pelagivirga sediminicola TaxID=2170575 RepID=A0A2T7G7E8_9RHOB|nr:hypothetical protein [Pelagivirga sediminicola]PVA10307.1 hypothetical protein DC366_08665 [Pelagivirga sediminicola]
MNRLSIYMIVLSASGIAGALVVAAFSLGYYSVWAIALCVVVGLAIAIPSGKLIAKRIKKEDPAWDARRDAPQPDLDRSRSSRTDPTE